MSYSKNKSPIPVPKPVPLPNIPIDPIDVLDSLLTCYKNIEIAKEEQLTMRMQVREQARIAIAAIEADTRKFESKLLINSAERLVIIEKISELSQKENLDEYTYKICEKYFDLLNKD